MRVPTLRNVALTAPYMHDGRFATLSAVLEHYSSIGARVAGAVAGGPRRYDARLPRSAFTAAERAELESFLDSLTDESFVKRFASGATPAVAAFRQSRPRVIAPPRASRYPWPFGRAEVPWTHPSIAAASRSSRPRFWATCCSRS
jgi:hypothetical protein